MKPGHRPGWPGWATNTLREMAREGKGAREIAAALNVGVRKFSYDAVKRRAGRVGVAIRKANRGRAFNIVRIPAGKISIPAVVAAERDMAMSLPQTLTASIMGDPMPGRSALDRRS